MAPNGPTLNPWQVATSLLMLATLAGCLTAWIWAIGRLLRRRPLLEEPPATVVPWGARSVLAVVVLYFVVQVGVAWLYGQAMRAGLLGAIPEGGLEELPAIDQLGIMMLINLALAGLVPVLLHATSGATRRDFGLGDASTLGRDLRRGFVACLLLMPPVFGVFSLAQQVWKPHMHPIYDAVREQASGVNAALVFVSAVFAAPLAEELLFRGVLLGWLTRAATLAGLRRRKLDPRPENEVWLVREALRNPAEPTVWDTPEAAPDDPPTVEPEGLTDRPTMAWGPAAWLPNVIVSLLFAGLHVGQWPAPVPLFVLSLGLGWLYQRTGRLGAPVALHATFNGFSTLVLLLAAGSGELPKVNPAPQPAEVEARVSRPCHAAGSPELTAGIGDLGFPRRASGRAGALDRSRPSRGAGPARDRAGRLP